jgi:hypothetical protein
VSNTYGANQLLIHPISDTPNLGLPDAPEWWGKTKMEWRRSWPDCSTKQIKTEKKTTKKVFDWLLKSKMAGYMGALCAPGRGGASGSLRTLFWPILGKNMDLSNVVTLLPATEWDVLTLFQHQRLSDT